SAIDLQGILYAIEFVLALARLLFTHRHVLFEQFFTALEQAKDDWDAGVAQFLEVRHCVETRSRTRMASHKNEAAFLRSGRRPFEIVIRVHWLIVLANANQRHVDVEPREVEVIGIAAEESGLELRHKYETNVGVFLVTIEIVLSALEKGDDVRTQASGF